MIYIEDSSMINYTTVILAESQIANFLSRGVDLGMEWRLWVRVWPLRRLLIQ